MTRNGKIARLPQNIREQINLRLQNGEEGKQILEWLNSVPIVQSFTTAKFGGQPINDVNLSAWKSGGYRDWLAQQDFGDVLRQFRADTSLFKKAAAEPVTDQLGLYFAAALAVAIRRLPAQGESSAIPFDLLRPFLAALSALRKDDHRARRLDIEQGRLDLQTKKHRVLKADLPPDGDPGIPDEVIEKIEKELRLL